ncbi:TPA: gamma-glutamylcyclotransferase [Candidatus Sumerlaeota bacterium]|jgi:hypothetical protein|nr:gamma-glutamylcyclotransferase [Candidatus Sumerlaeota bacterium]
MTSTSDKKGEPVVLHGKREELYYFAYGSDMNTKQIQERCSSPKAIGVAKLPDYRIAFFGETKIWDSGLETVLEDPGHNVWGVIYALSSADRQGLDLWQDARLDGAGANFHYPVVLTDTEGVTRTVLLYKKDRTDQPQLPSQEYLDFIAEGAAEHNLPAEYIEELRTMASKKARYPVPHRKKGAEFLMLHSCTDCEG